jgi:hypothetical protein
MFLSILFTFLKADVLSTLVTWCRSWIEVLICHHCAAGRHTIGYIREVRKAAHRYGIRLSQFGRRESRRPVNASLDLISVSQARSASVRIHMMASCRPQTVVVRSLDLSAQGLHTTSLFAYLLRHQKLQDHWPVPQGDRHFA